MTGRRGRGEGAVYQRADGLWLAVVDLGWVGGKRRRRTVSARTKTEVLRKLRALQRELDAGVMSDAATVEQWATYWLNDIAKPSVRPRTWVGYEGYVRRWVIPHLGRHKLADLRAQHVRTMIQTMAAAGLSTTTQRHAYTITHRMLEVARREGRTMRNAADDMVDPPPVGSGTHGKLTLPEVQQIVRVLAGGWPEGSRWGAALFAGLRQGEALGLRWDDVDLGGRVIRVRRSAGRVTGQGIVVGPPKSVKSIRDVYMIEALAELLGRHPETTRVGFVWPGATPETPRNHRVDWARWKDLLRAAGVQDVPLHAARATTASLLMAAGVPDVITAEVLGHAGVQITRDHYLQGDDGMRKDAMTALGALMEGKP